MGVDFAGKGNSDISINKEGTNPGSLGTSKDQTVKFAGDGGKDVNHANTPPAKSQPITGEGTVKFAGDVNK